MATKIFVNLPVKDLRQSMNFFSQLGYTFNPQFSNEKGACLVISEDIYAMLLTTPFFESFIPGKTAADTTKTKEVLLCLSSESKEAVNNLVDKAVAAGANEFKEPQDHGFMFFRTFEDLDGHIWEIMWMDPAAAVPEVEVGQVEAVGS